MNFNDHDTGHVAVGFNGTTFVNIDTSDLDLLLHCWRLSTCDSCLSPKNHYPCSWCAVSSTCVPNTLTIPHTSIRLGILAPLRSESICPLSWRERWELRAKRFSCRCSTMTLMSVVVAVLSTLLGVLLLWALGKLIKGGMRRWRKREEDWWRMHEWRWKAIVKWRRGQVNQTCSDTGTTEDAERQPLLNGG